MAFPIRTLPCLLAAGVLLAAVPDPGSRAPGLRLVPIEDGLREDAPGNDLARIAETNLSRVARAAGVDLAGPLPPLVVHNYADGRLFYVFFKTTEGALGDRPYLIQRIRKTERTWAAPDAEPEERVTWKVEAFKTIAGALKRADRHYGSFGLHGAWRRTVTKEYEIGFGEVPGACEGTSWPYGPQSLFHDLQDYAPEPGLFDEVEFSRTTRWTLAVGFDADGDYRVASPELGFDLPDDPPDESAARPAPNPASAGLVLEAGTGVGAFRLGESTAEDLARLFGEPIEAVEVGRGHSNHSVAVSFTVNFGADGAANTLITHGDFAGRTAKGLRLWESRARVMELYGPPGGQLADAPHWTYPGIVIFFDAFQRVRRIVLTPAG